MNGRLIVCVVGLASLVNVAGAGVLPEGFEKNNATFRGPASSGCYRDVGSLPTAWSEKDNKGILWHVKLDSPGFASPIVWGDKVIVTTADETKRQVACFDAASGKSLWKTELPKAAGTTAAYTLNTQSDEWNKRMHAASTPATNGKQVFALFSNGQLAALDLQTGTVTWTVGLGKTSDNAFGLANSLLVFGDTVIVVFQGEPAFIAAYDAATGKGRWKTPRASPTWASPILIKTAAGKKQVVLPSNPDVTAWDPETGKVAWKADVMTTSPTYCTGPSPVFADGMVVVNAENNGIIGIDPDKGQQAWIVKELPNGDGFADGISMTTDGKNVYQYFKTAVTCVAAKTGKVVKQKELDESASYASPIFAGGNLYLFGSGETTILKADPAADFPAVGKGSLNDSSDTSPAAANGRLYLRTDEALYCIGAK